MKVFCDDFMNIFVLQGDSQTKKEAAWAISNLTIYGNKEQASIEKKCPNNFLNKHL